MGETKTKLDKNKILDTAFSEWGKTAFHNISLTNISNRLDISKSALYKYFENKEELIDEMAKILENDIFNLIKKSDNLNDYIENNITFFIRNHNKLFFYTIIYANKKEYLDSLKKIIEEININFDKRLLLFVNTTILFYLSFFFFYKFYDNKKFSFKRINISEKEFTEVKVQIFDIINNGILNKKAEIEINYEEIEKVTTITIEDIPQKSELLSKISNIIAKYGIWDTTTDKISKELNIPKSTLFCYFKNKDEILQKTLKEEFSKIKELYLSRISHFNNFFEKYYALINTTYTHLLYDINHLKIINWFHYQNIDIIEAKKDFFEIYNFMVTEIKNNLLKNIFQIDVFPIIYTNIHIVKLILLKNFFDIELNKQTIRDLYKSILIGINGGKDE